MFLEPSHLNQFIATVLPVWLVFILKASPYSIFVLFAVIITTAMTTSGTSVVVYVGLIMYALICFLRKENKRYIKRKTFYLMSFVICAGILIIIILLQKTDLISTFQHFINLAFEGSNIADESNIERTTPTKNHKHHWAKSIVCKQLHNKYRYNADCKPYSFSLF